MKKIIYPLFGDKGASPLAILMILFSAFLAGCERTLDLEDSSTGASNGLTINAMAVTGSELKVYLSRAYPVDKTPTMQYYDYDHATYQKDDGTLDYISDEYYLKTVITGAKVEAEVNGQVYNIAWSEMDACYKSNYIVKEGDHIIISASIDNQEAKVETTVPTSPHIEVVKHEVLAENPYIQVNGVSFETDTIMRITCRIADTGGNQYFRLRIRGERSLKFSYWVGSLGGNKTEYNMYYYMMQDVFFSTDELFADNRLASNFGGWPAYFSNVFDNSKLNGGSRTFVVDSPKIPASGRSTLSGDELWEEEIPSVPARVMVELQAISPELYRYLKSVELYRVTENDAFSEPVQIYSNVKNGWGIFGSLSSSRVFIPYD
ncbi:MAG: DUF4249 family protein [Bacteroidaceae bacterium]|nr:DUF4249 family protein [Bacteroidaceae bacterium]